MKIPRPLREAANTDHSNVYFIMLLLSEGWTEEGRAVYNKALLFSPSHPLRDKVSIYYPMSFTFVWFSAVS
jgi:hypothetical protein